MSPPPPPPPPTLAQIQAWLGTFAQPGPPGPGDPAWPNGATYLERLDATLRKLYMAVTRLERMAYFDVAKADTGGPVLAEWPNDPNNPPDKSPPPPPPMVPPR